MASIRRTLSPYYHNGGAGPFSARSPSHKSLLNGKSQPSSPSLSTALRRLLAGASTLLYSRRWHRSIFRYFIFFSIGFLLGMLPLSHVDDTPSARDLSFGRKMDGVVVNSVELGTVRERLKSNDRKSGSIVVNSVELAVKRDGLELKCRKQENVAVNSVELRVERERIAVNHRKQLIIVTPTYNRGLQAYFLNRLGQVLRLVPLPLLWVVVEMTEASAETAEFLRKTGVMYRHLVCTKNSTDVKDRGVHQRNTALEHIERHKLDGIVYFADDDKVYSLELFDSLREIRRFGTWPVAMLAQSKNKAILEGPVCNGSKVIGWHTNEKSKRLRRFHVDMSGFAFNSTILWDPKRWQRPTSNPIRQLDTVKEGFQETTFIEQVVENEYQMEGSGPSCSRIMNWHLHLEAGKFVYPRGWLLQKNLDVVLPVI